MVKGRLVQERNKVRDMGEEEVAASLNLNSRRAPVVFMTGKTETRKIRRRKMAMARLQQ